MTNTDDVIEIKTTVSSVQICADLQFNCSSVKASTGLYFEHFVIALVGANLYSL